MKLQKAKQTSSPVQTSSSVPRTFNGVGKKKNFKSKKTNNFHKNNKTNDDKKNNIKVVRKSKWKWKKKTKSKNVNDKHRQTPKGTVPPADLEKKRFHVPTEPAECSSNWKKLCLSSLKEETITDNQEKKKMKKSLFPDSQLKVLGVHGSVLLNGKSGSSSKEENDKKKEEKAQETTKKADLWFDDVDESLIETTIPCEEPVESETKTAQSTTSDKVTAFVALDCEMVGTGESGINDMLARVSVVNQYGHCLYDRYVKPTKAITDYRTRFSGITPDLLKDGTDFETVQQDVRDFLKERILAGHALQNDFKVLYLDHPKKLIRDTSKYKPFRKLSNNRTPSLKMLAKEVLGITIQHGSHNSVIDAQVAMRLYLKHRTDWESRLKCKRKKSKLKRKMKAAKKKHKVKD